MIEVVWEFVVVPEFQGQFELVYGPGGAWSRLFDQSPGFRGVTLLHDTHSPRRYLTIEVWDSESQREQALCDGADVYAALEADLAAWTEARTEVGVFRLRAELAVRPRGKTRRRDRRSPR